MKRFPTRSRCSVVCMGNMVKKMIEAQERQMSGNARG